MLSTTLVYYNSIDIQKAHFFQKRMVLRMDKKILTILLSKYLLIFSKMEQFS